MENIREIVSNNLINLRKQNKMTQLDLAKRVNYSNKAVSRWEKGEVLPDVETIALLAEIFDVPVSYILEKQEKREEKSTKKTTTKEVLSQIFTICEIWTIIAVVFAYFIITKEKVMWQLFLWGIPATALILIVLNRKAKNNIANFIYGTVLVWSIIVCVFLHLLNTLPWYIFVVGVPIQGLLIIRYLFNFKQKTIITKPFIKKK